MSWRESRHVFGGPSKIISSFWRSARQRDGMCVCAGISWSCEKAFEVPNQDGQYVSWGAISSSSGHYDRWGGRKRTSGHCGAPPETTRLTLDKGPPITCYVYNGPNHFARNCVKRQSAAYTHCYQCNKAGHLGKNCPGNKVGDETSVPVHSPYTR